MGIERATVISMKSRALILTIKPAYSWVINMDKGQKLRGNN